MAVVSTPFSREKILQIARTLPADLHVLSKLGEMLQDVNSELEQIAELLRRDVALATRIVRISNSPMFGGGGSIASIEEAVNRVGFSEIMKLVGTASAARMTERALEAYDISAQKLRDSMLFGAFAAEALARLSGADTRVAYTAGLLRPLGMMVLDRAGRGGLPWTERYSVARWPTYSVWEGGIFGIDNCEVTALILDEWRFPRELSAALRSHYLTRPSDYDNRLASLLNVGGHVAEKAGRAFAGETSWWAAQPEKLQAAGVSEEDLETAQAQAETGLEAALSALAS